MSSAYNKTVCNLPATAQGEDMKIGELAKAA
jgi:hypothetical protein